MCARVYLLVDGDFKQLVILERLGAEHQTEIVFGKIARGGAAVVAESDTVAASPMEHVERRSPRMLFVAPRRALRCGAVGSVDTSGHH